MYCSNCGTKIEGNSRYCSNCGHNIEKLNSNSNQDFQTNNQHSKKNPFELFIDGWKHIFNYKGITSRRGFWWFYLFNALTGVLVFLFLYLLSAQDSFIDQLALTIFYLPLTSIGARRMRDTNQSIYWAIIPIGLQWFFQPFMVGDYVSSFGNLIAFPFAIVFIVLACQRTKYSGNRERIN
ncbi:DUF805 domain-containing protein [Staphylococcus caprae]|uniref:DUF805 domain-containing protein n=1 Tax=Staphylococcus caprae TaxID=29380 RepID=UPI001F5A4A73|nr:DUF805 domain-containing protein [Staphylococcus caprae]